VKFYTNPIWIFIVCLALLLICYLPGLNETYFPYDDFELLKIPQVQNPLSWASLSSILTIGNHVDFYPIRDLSYWIDVHTFGVENYTAFRIENFVLFTASIYMMFKIALRLGIQNKIALMISIIWLLHPYHSELLMWVSSRKDILTILFSSLAIDQYLKWQDSKYKRSYLLSLVFFTLGLLSKASFSLVPAAIFVGLLIFRRSKHQLMSLLPFIILGLISSIVQSFVYSRINDMRFYYEFSYRLFGSLAALGRTLSGLILPQINAVDVENWGNWASLNSSFAWVGVVAVCIATLGLFWSLKTKNFSMFVIILSIASLYLPVSALLFPHRNFYSTRYMEAPFLTAAVGLMWSLNRISSAKYLSAFFVGLGTFLFLATFFEAKNWQSNLAIIEKSQKISPKNVAIKSVLYQEFLKQRNHPSDAQDLEQKIKQLSEHLKNSCTGIEAKHFRNGNECFNYYRLLAIAPPANMSQSAYQDNIDRIYQSLVQVNPFGADRYKNLLQAQGVLSGHLQEASMGEYLENLHEMYQFKHTTQLRILETIRLCLNGDKVLASDLQQKYLAFSLLDQMTQTQFYSQIVSGEIKEKLRNCTLL